MFNDKKFKVNMKFADESIKAKSMIKKPIKIIPSDDVRDVVGTCTKATREADGSITADFVVKNTRQSPDTLNLLKNGFIQHVSSTVWKNKQTGRYEILSFHFTDGKSKEESATINLESCKFLRESCGQKIYESATATPIFFTEKLPSYWKTNDA